MLKYFIILVFLISCSRADEARTVRELPLPTGYQRATYKKGNYSHWLQGAPLKKTKTIALHDGRSYKPGSNWYKIAAVLDFPLLFDQDLE
jgi:hypothetical protein